MSNGTTVRQRPMGTDMDGQIPSSPKEDKVDGEKFPVSMLVGVLGTALVIFTVMPYLGIFMPPARRTDLGWWRDGYVLDGIASMEKVTQLQQLGFIGVKSSYPYKEGPDSTMIKMISDLKSKGMRLAVTLSVDGEDKDEYSALQAHAEQWLSAGVDGISLSLSVPFVPSSSILSLQNLTSTIRTVIQGHRAAQGITDKILLSVESSNVVDRVAAMEGGADLVQGDSLCFPADSQATSEQILGTLSSIEDMGDQVAVMWKVCESAQDSMLLRILSLLLPGTPMAPASISTRHLEELALIKEWPAVRWGSLEKVTVDESIFSYVLWAKGRMYDKLIIIVNLSEKKNTQNYVKKLDKFKVPAKGRIVLVEGDLKKYGKVVDMDNLEVNGRELMLIQFPAMGI